MRIGFGLLNWLYRVAARTGARKTCSFYLYFFVPLMLAHHMRADIYSIYYTCLNGVDLLC